MESHASLYPRYWFLTLGKIGEILLFFLSLFPSPTVYSSHSLVSFSTILELYLFVRHNARTTGRVLLSCFKWKSKTSINPISNCISLFNAGSIKHSYQRTSYTFQRILMVCHIQDDEIVSRNNRTRCPSGRLNLWRCQLPIPIRNCLSLLKVLTITVIPSSYMTCKFTLTFLQTISQSTLCNLSRW